MNEQPHPGHHDCLPPMAAKLTEEQFLDLLNNHPELHELLALDPHYGEYGS